MKLRATITALVVLLSGCSLVVAGEVDNLNLNSNAKRTVRMRLLDMDPHIGQFNDIQIINPMTNQIEARAILDPLPTGCFELVWPLGASVVANRIDFYADLNMDRMLSMPGDDHLWRRTMMEGEDGEGFHLFIHDVMFDDIRESPGTALGADLDIALTGVDEHDGRLVTVTAIRRFRESDGSPLVESVFGIIIVGAVEGGVVNARLPGMLDSGGDHIIEIDFGEGATTCRGEFVAPAGGLTISDLSGLDCTVTDRHMVFRDVTDEDCR